MPPSSATRGQFANRRARLVRKIDVVPVPDGMPKTLVEIARSVLELFPTGGADDDQTYPMPDEEELLSAMKDLLPAPADIFAADIFMGPLFPIAVLHDIASLYGCGVVDSDFKDGLNLSDLEQRNNSISSIIWFCFMLDCNIETTTQVSNMFKASRRIVSPRSNGAPTGIYVRRDGVRQTLEAAPAEGPIDQTAAPVNHGIPGNIRSPDPPSHGSGNNLDLRIATPRPDGGSRTARPVPSSGLSSAPDGFDDIRKSNYVNQYFKNHKFNGEIDQSIELFLRDYKVCGRQFKLTKQQMADYFVNILEGPARTFFFNNADDSMNFDRMAALMMKEYNSDARQQQVKSSLDTLRLRTFMSEYEITSLSEGLAKLVNRIEDLTPQGPPHARSEGNKIEFLRKAVLGYEWSKNAVRSIVSSAYTFNAFVTALHEGIQIENEMRLLSHETGVVESDTHFQQYGRHPRHVKKHASRPQGPPDRALRKPFSRSFEESRRRNECHKCGDRWHAGHRCSPGSIRQHIRDRLNKGESSVHIVSELVQGMEGELASGASEDEPLAPSNNEHVQMDDGNETNVRFASVQEFDELLDKADTSRDMAEEADQVWFTHHLSAAKGQGF